MTEAFSWLGSLVESLGSLIPRRVIVRATHAGVKWIWGRHVREMNAGIHWYWPVTTEAVTIVIARQTLNLPTQALVTKDRQQVVAGAVVVYSINDVVKAIGERNWDVDTTINDIAQTALVKVISKFSLEELLDSLDSDIEERLTQTCRRQLDKFGVYVHRCALTDFSTCRVYKVLGDSPFKSPADEGEE
ncbi:MAG: SPFH domain-containing protein [Planctomycetota bacterium]|nr:MAG: SPFH domain-containing protein [Planctomycetota bacterium]REJ92036.1 MAG: SPFH domain-containing protein [Planctomycetota bacterium]REK28572.1 MAG: SPFH domain-containing protein [Planctomycetota bacterium]REK39187.1 MAG: SPFH domain-containing protein [Planctomycetota bacterium]